MYERGTYENAKENQHKLRVVNIPHREIPKLEMFVAYLNTEHKAAITAEARDDERIHALGVLNI